jgi:hypothetical protein
VGEIILEWWAICVGISTALDLTLIVDGDTAKRKKSGVAPIDIDAIIDAAKGSCP